MTSVTHRSFGRIALTVIFSLLALNAWAQIVLRVLGSGDDPPALVALQLLIGVAGTAAAVGSWTDAPWSPIAAMAYGLVTAGMLVALTPLLQLPPEARPGLWFGASLVLLSSLWAARYLRRTRSLRAPSEIS